MKNIEPLKIHNDGEMSVHPDKRLKQIKIDDNLEALSKYMDGLFRVPGTGWRFGLDSLIGLIPNIGDLSTSVISFYILIAGVRYGVPKITLVRMAFNIGLDYLVGIIPFIGDAFDFLWKSNQKNIKLIRERGAGLGSGTTGDWIFVTLIIAGLIALLFFSIFLSIVFLGFLLKGIWDFSWKPFGT